MSKKKEIKPHLLSLLLTLSLFLPLSIPLFGDSYKGEILYLWENTSKGNVWTWNFSFPNGIKVMGKWEDGFNGQGTMTYTDGSKYIGEWEEFKPWNGEGYDKNGNFIGKWVNGVQQK